MLKTAIISGNAPQPVARYSQAIRIDKMFYVQGIIALDPQTGKLLDGGIKEQAQRVFESIHALLDAAGMDPENVIKVTAFLADLADYPQFNDVYNQFFHAGTPPVRTTVQTKLPFAALVEVEVTAFAEED